MTRAHHPRADFLLIAAALALAGCGKGDTAPPPPTARAGATIGLYTSLPIAWNEAADVQGLLADEAPPHWALASLRQRGEVIPLDTLSPLSLPADGVLLLAQPRPLTPQENVALDNWVRGGGHVLLVADPMLTADSHFAIGDPRRPQDIAMLSPILGRWGLVLEFDEAQPPGERFVRLPEGDMPVALPGRLRPAGKSGDVAGRCRLEAEGLLADCTVGKGRVVALADAALLENPEDSAQVSKRRVILAGLLDRVAVRSGAGR